MKKDGTGKGRTLLRHGAVVLAFVLVAALVFAPVWVLGGRYTVSAVHDMQTKLPRADSDLQLTEQYDPQPNTFGIVEGTAVTGGMHFGRLECSRIGLDCPVYYGANRVCLRAGAAASTAYSLPGYGKSTVVTGYNTTVFRNLGQLKKGDLIDFSTNWGHFSYRVTDRQVLTSDASVDVAVVDKEKLILFCTYPQSPFGNLENKRLYVFCEKASGPAVEVSANG